MTVKRTIRIAFARIQQESNEFSTVESTIEDFERTHYMEGNVLLEAIKPTGKEAEGFMKNAELSGFYKGIQEKNSEAQIEIVPLFSAWAVSGGPLSAETQSLFENRLMSKLKDAGPIDGVFFTMHGALRATGIPNPEERYLQKIKEVVGANTPIAVTLDLHAHLRGDLVELTDVLCAYRTNPHRDHAKVGARAAKILVDVILGKTKVAKTWRYLPMILGGGSTIDFLPTMLPVFRKLKKIEEDPRVLYVSLFMVHPFLNSPDLGWAVHVMTQNDVQLADQLADDIANLAWDVRHKMPPEFDPPDRALAKVRKNKMARKLGTICLCDTSDAVGAGGTGENTHLLAYLLTHAKDLLSYVPVRGPQVFEQLVNTKVGAQVSVTVGGYLQPDINPEVAVAGRLTYNQATKAFGQVAVVDAGHVQLVITEGAPLAFKPEFYENVGLSVWKADMVVTKGFFPPRIFFALHSRKTLNVATKGITDLDLYKTLDFDGPVHPIKALPGWRKADAERRQANPK